MKFVKWLYRVLNYLVLIGLIGSYLAPFVDPRIFWPISFFGLSFTLWLGLCCLMILLGIWLKQKKAIYNVIVLIVGLPLIMRSINVGGADSTQVAELRIASFNTFGFGHTKDNSHTLDAVLREEKIDIAVLHEWRRGRGVVVEQPFAYHKEIHRSVNTGIQILSNYPILHTDKIDLADSYGDAAFADIKLKDDTIRIYMLHLETNHLTPKDYHRIRDIDFDSSYTQHAKGIMSRIRTAMIKRADQVEMVVKHMQSCKHPIVICMDLNDTPQSYAYQQLKNGRNDAFTEAGSGWEGTYVKPLPFLRIDYILYDDLFDCLEYESTDRIFSDHKLIFAGFTMRK